MIVTMAVLAGVLVGIFDAFFFQRQKKFIKLFSVMLADALCCNLIAIIISDIYFRCNGESSFFTAYVYSEKFPYIYAAIVLGAGLLWSYLFAVIDGKLFYTKGEQKPVKKSYYVGYVSLDFPLRLNHTYII